MPGTAHFQQPEQSIFCRSTQHALDAADVPIVYFNPKTVEHKRMEMLDQDQIKDAFKNQQVQVSIPTAKPCNNFWKVRIGRKTEFTADELRKL